jgi:hypothetical protein
MPAIPRRQQTKEYKGRTRVNKNTPHVADVTEESYTDLIAVEMAEAFESNAGSIHGHVYLTVEGMEELADLFEEVPIPLRGIVYGKFLKELDSRGINYDPEQFRKTH